MGEIEVPANVVGRRYLCDECGEEMRRDDSRGILPVSPPLFPHVCANGHTANLHRHYPGHDVFIHAAPHDTPTAEG